MLANSLVYGFRQGPSADYSDTCLLWMDKGGPSFASPDTAVGPDSLSYALGMAAVLLSGLAWFALVAGLRWTTATRLTALPLAVLLIGQARLAASPFAHTPWASIDSLPWSMILLAVDVAAGCAACAVLTRWRDSFRLMLRGWVAIWGVASFSQIRLVSDDMVMTFWNEANWDAPPGTGYTCAIAPLIAGVAIIVMTLRDRSRRGVQRHAEERVTVGVG